MPTNILYPELRDTKSDFLHQPKLVKDHIDHILTVSQEITLRSHKVGIRNYNVAWQDDISCIMKTLELDEEVTSALSATGQRVFMKMRKGGGRPGGDAGNGLGVGRGTVY